MQSDVLIHPKHLFLHQIMKCEQQVQHLGCIQASVHVPELSVLERKFLHRLALFMNLQNTHTTFEIWKTTLDLS